MTAGLASWYWIINGLWWLLIGGASVVFLIGLLATAIESWRKKRREAK